MSRLKDSLSDPWFLLGWVEGASLGYFAGFIASWGLFLVGGYDRKWLGFVALAFIGWFVMNACRRYQEARLGLLRRRRRRARI